MWWGWSRDIQHDLCHVYKAGGRAACPDRRTNTGQVDGSRLNTWTPQRQQVIDPTSMNDFILRYTASLYLKLSILFWVYQTIPFWNLPSFYLHWRANDKEWISTGICSNDLITLQLLFVPSQCPFPAGINGSNTAFMFWSTVQFSFLFVTHLISQLSTYECNLRTKDILGRTTEETENYSSRLTRRRTFFKTSSKQFWADKRETASVFQHRSRCCCTQCQ